MTVDDTSIPLAERLRPKKLDEVVGQSHLLDQGKALRQMIDTGKAHSMILWGPPGVGKTTLARLMAQCFQCHFIALSAVFSGVKDIRAAVQEAQDLKAKIHQPTLLFIDEIHRFNSAQQDALLPYVEAGIITLIGATTENPSFSLNRALLSRLRLYTLKVLNESELIELIHRCQQSMNISVQFEIDALEQLAQHADGDARRLINFTEVILTNCQHFAQATIDAAFIKQSLASAVRQFDKQGDIFYDQISALHKSVRGSHPDAALYWLCRMLDGGADPLYIARRIIRMAWEDIGIADPRAIQIANDAAQTYERLGSPEGELALGQAVIYLAIAAKSNAGYKAFNQAMRHVKEHGSHAVPPHLKNKAEAPYRYAHDEPYAYAAGVSYLPENMPAPHWYQPTTRGLESKIKEKMDFLKTLDKKHNI